MSDTPRIALIHATPVAMAPIHAAMAELWPQAAAFDLLESALSLDAQSGAAVPVSFDTRFADLGDYARSIGADGILFTCSAFGPSIDKVAARLAPMPVLKPNTAMFERAIGQGDRIGMIATFAPAVAEMQQEFRTMAAQAGSNAQLTTVLAEGAIAALRAGDGSAHDQLCAQAAAQLSGCDAIMLAHFSTARAQGAVAGMNDVPVLSSPASAVQKLQQLLPNSPTG